MSKNGEDRVLGHCPHARGIYSDNARTEPRSRTRTGEQQSWRRPRSADRGRLSWIGGTSPEGKFPMEPEEEWVRGPFRKETEDRTVWVGRDKVPEGTQERSGKGAVWTWARQDNYPTLSECEHVKARLSDKKGLYFEGWPRLVRTRGLEGSELYCQCDSGQADSKQPLGLAGLSPGPASGWYLQYKIVSPGQSMPLLSNMSNTELSCSHVLIQRSLFSFRIGSQTCSQSWCVPPSCQSHFSFFKRKSFERLCWPPVFSHGDQTNNRKALAHASLNSLGSQDAEILLCQRSPVLVWIHFHSWGSFEVDGSHTVYLVLLQRFLYCILFYKD